MVKLELEPSSSSLPRPYSPTLCICVPNPCHFKPKPCGILEQIIPFLATVALFMLFLAYLYTHLYNTQAPISCRHTHTQSILCLCSVYWAFESRVRCDFLQEASVKFHPYPCCSPMAPYTALSMHLPCRIVCRACHCGQHVSAVRLRALAQGLTQNLAQMGLAHSLQIWTEPNW